LLTGSANILTLPKISESLAGRMEIVTLLPLSRAEIRGQRPAFLQNALAGQLAKSAEKMIGPDLIRAVLTGGYPEMLDRARPDRRSAWARSYIQAIVQRDVREIVDVEKLDHVPRLLQVLAHYSAKLTNSRLLLARALRTTMSMFGRSRNLQDLGVMESSHHGQGRALVTFQVVAGSRPIDPRQNRPRHAK
jgi:predicted AAA+ superfamily ATPase